MDTVFTIIAALGIAVLIAVALTFGFALFAFIVCVAVVSALLFYAKAWWLRWRFVDNASKREQEGRAHIIEGSYVEISGDNDKRSDI